MVKALEILKKLKVVKFDWKHSGEAEVGLIAEEVVKVFPEAVHYKDDRIEGLKILPLIALVIKAIQELEVNHAKLR